MFNLLERLKNNKKGLFCLFSHLNDSLHMHTAQSQSVEMDNVTYIYKREVLTCHT